MKSDARALELLAEAERPIFRYMHQFPRLLLEIIGKQHPNPATKITQTAFSSRVKELAASLTV